MHVFIDNYSNTYLGNLLPEIKYGYEVDLYLKISDIIL